MDYVPSDPLLLYILELHSMVKDEDVEEIVSEHLLKGRIVTRLVYKDNYGRWYKTLRRHRFL